MGQYYRAYLRDVGGNEKTYAFMPSKLMETSWFDNVQVNKVAFEIFNWPCRVAWIGDYSDCAGCPEEIYKRTWEMPADYCLGYLENYPLDYDFNLRDMYLINHSKKLFVNCNDYASRCNRNGWIIHPLPLLTCIGNGQGGGDYYSDNGTEYIGTWAFDWVSFDFEKPDLKIYSEIKPTFAED